MPLEQNKEDDDRDDRHGHARRHAARVGGHHALHRHQAHLQGHVRAGVQHQRRPEEVIPLVDKGEDSRRRQRGPDHGQQDAPPDAQITGAVHLPRLDQIIGHGLERLPQQEDIEDSRQVGED